MPRIVVFGGLMLDITFEIPRWPQPDEDDVIYTEQLILSPGGKGINQSVGASRLGAKVYLVGSVGSDVAGRTIMETLARENVNVDLVVTNPSVGTGIVGILLHETKPTYIARKGASILLSESQLERASGYVTPESVVLVNHELPQAIVEAALRLAKARGATTILNPGPLVPWLSTISYLPLVDYLIPNRSEAQAILATDQSDPIALIRGLLQRGVKAVCITLGERGCIFADQDTVERPLVQPALDVDVVDVTGAGDSFCAAWAVGIAEGRPIRDVIKIAIAASARACTRRGSMTAMPYRHELGSD